MDAFDRRLLAAVQANSRQTSEELGGAVGLSPSACFRRLQKLRALGAIESEVAVVAPEKVGRPLMMIVQISLERERPEIIDNFKREMLSTPEVMQCFYVTGESDFILIMTAKSMQDYERFTKQFFFKNANIRRFNTSVVMDRVKFGLAVPIDE